MLASEAAQSGAIVHFARRLHENARNIFFGEVKMYYIRDNYFRTPALEFFCTYCAFKVPKPAVFAQTTPVCPSPKYNIETIQLPLEDT